MEFFGIGILGSILMFVGLLFSREKDNKANYAKQVGFILGVSHLCTLVSLPLYGNLFGFVPMLVTSVVLGTLLKGTK